MRVFHNRMDFTRFKHILQRFLEGRAIFIHHYVLMHTHYHLLAWCEDTSELPSVIKSTCVSYNYYYRRRYRYRGHLWHSRYRTIRINDENQWAQCGRYIELNSVFAGICDDPRDYPWSSYHYYERGKRDPLVRPILAGEKSRQCRRGAEDRDYREFILAGIDLDYRRLKREFEKEKFSIRNIATPNSRSRT